MPRITEMFCFAISDTDDDDEGVVAIRTHEGMLPLVGADMARIESIMPHAQAIADETGSPLRIYKFTHREQVGEVLPRQK